MSTWVVVGAGQMGSALLRGWLATPPLAPPHVVAPRPSAEVTSWAAANQIVLNAPARAADVLVIAVKPQIYPEILENLKAWVDPSTWVISVMAGVTLSRLASDFETERCVRVMPNTPSAIGKGICLVAPHPDSPEDAMAQARELLTPLGHVEGPLSEIELRATTALTGCGPAYVFHLVEVMAAGAVAEGVPPEIAERLAVETIAGAAALLVQSDAGPAVLREAVTSPNGVTEAALNVLMQRDAMPSLMHRAIAAAIARDAALSEPS